MLVSILARQRVLLMLCDFTIKHSGAAIKTDVIISNVHSSDDVSISPGSGIFKTFAGNVRFRAIIGIGKKLFEAISPKFSSEKSFYAI